MLVAATATSSFSSAEVPWSPATAVAHRAGLRRSLQASQGNGCQARPPANPGPAILQGSALLAKLTRQGLHEDLHCACNHLCRRSHLRRQWQYNHHARCFAALLTLPKLECRSIYGRRHGCCWGCHRVDPATCGSPLAKLNHQLMSTSGDDCSTQSTAGQHGCWQTALQQH